MNHEWTPMITNKKETAQCSILTGKCTDSGMACPDCSLGLQHSSFVFIGVDSWLQLQ